MKSLLMVTIMIVASGCNDEFAKQKASTAFSSHGSIYHEGSEFEVVLRADGDVEIHTSDGNSWRLIHGAIELSNGNGAVLIRKVKP